MTGLDTVIDLRNRGLKPKAVFVDLVLAPAAIEDPLSLSGIVNVEILASDSLASIDFRALVGLTVHVYDNAGDPNRQRKVASMVAAVEPALLVVPMVGGATWTVHRRFAGDPPTSDRTTL